MASGEAIVDTLEELCRDLLVALEATSLLDEENGLGGENGLGKLLSVPTGVGIAGLVDVAGVVRFAPNLHAADGTPVRSMLQERLGEVVEVYVDNDATCAGAAECSHGAAVGPREVVFVALGTGIGGAILSGGRLLRGASNFAAELGHMVIDPRGLACGCGRRGCWELYASGSALGRLAREAALEGRAAFVQEIAGGDPDDIRGEHVVEAAAAHDREAGALLEEFAFFVALGLGNLASIFDPELIVIGGGLIRAGETVLRPVRDCFVSHLEGRGFRPTTTIVAAALGDRGGAVGAALLAASSGSESQAIGCAVASKMSAEPRARPERGAS
ncbi:MAG: ROK family protein [Acidimicrobiales bacterium]